MEYEAATRLLASILSKRGETVKDQDLYALVTRAREQGFLKCTLLLFLTKEWWEVGNRLWLSTIEGGKEGKEAKALRLTWRAVTNTLAEMKAERKVAVAAMEVLGGGGPGKERDGGLTERRPETREEFRAARFFGLTAGRPIKGTAAPVRSLRELLDSAGKEVTPQKSEGEMAAKAEAQAPNPGGRAQVSRGETSGPSTWLKIAARNTPLPESGSSSDCEAASMALLPTEAEPARAAGGQPQEEEKHREMMHELMKKLAELSTCQDTSEHPKEPEVECNPSGFLQQNQPATRGSLGGDVVTSIEVTLTNHQVTLIPTTAKGPLSSDGPHLGGLLAGRSSTSWQGVVVLPGVIDADYTGKIKIAYVLQPPVTILQGSRIAQIVPFPLMTNRGTSNSSVRGDHAFGSSVFDVFWTLNLAQRPQWQVIL
ncbi:uncharacterized protein LOC121659598 [Corvus kubaryi]|uniref:uncharacterized protein LOC121659598 n=1 Tax=Corvus kubaryi TaxID=68294 RepID=UPI001C04AA11|nr:uncharacterized protein LOC121659598 [Corvus kubaryi]